MKKKNTKPKDFFDLFWPIDFEEEEKKTIFNFFNNSSTIEFINLISDSKMRKTSNEDMRAMPLLCQMYILNSLLNSEEKYNQIIEQNNEIIKQNNQTLEQNKQTLEQNNQIIELLQKIADK